MRYDHLKAMKRHGAKECGHCEGEGWVEIRDCGIRCCCCNGKGYDEESIKGFAFYVTRRYTIRKHTLPHAA